VLLFWIVIVAVAGPLSGKLLEVQDNDTVNWLPATAESTQVYKQSAAFQNPDEAPAIIVYERTGGVTDADRAAAAKDAQVFADFPSCRARSSARWSPRTARRCS
jgi:RND superfamily putative drug exporter